MAPIKWRIVLIFVSNMRVHVILRRFIEMERTIVVSKTVSIARISDIICVNWMFKDGRTVITYENHLCD